MSRIEPPYTDEAEVAVLGAAMLSETGHVEVVDRLHAGMFFRAPHRAVFEALEALSDRGVAADTVTVGEQLSAAGKLDEVGGPVALHDLTSYTPAAVNVGRYCELVERAWRARDVIAGARQLATAASESWRDGVDDAIDATVESWTRSGTDDGLVSVDQAEQALKVRLAGGEPIPTWSTGWSLVDRVYRVPRGLLTVVTGIPGSGKSTWVDCAVYNILKKNDDVNVAMFSPEQAPPDNHLLNLLHTALGTDPMTADMPLVDRGVGWLRGRVTWLDDQRDNTLSGVLSRARMAVRRRGCKVVVIDPWNKLRHDRSKHQRDDLYIQEALSRLTRFARKEQVAVLLVAHPKIMEREPKSETRVRPPTAYSISGGSEWDNQADVIVTVHRDKQGEQVRSSIVQVIVSKVRFEGRIGRVGAVELEFDARQRRYHGLMQSTESVASGHAA